MSIRKVFILVTILFSVVVNAQERELDSLLTLLDNHQHQDTLKVNILNQIPQYYTVTDISKSETYIKEAIAISEHINYTEGLAEAYMKYGVLNVQQGNYNKALESALHAKQLQDSLQDKEGLIYTNSTIAQVYTHLNKPEKAVEIQLENLSFFKNDSLNLNKARIHFYLATAYDNIYDYTNAKDHYKKAKHIANKNSFLTGVHIANSSLGIIARQEGDYKESINYLESALAFYKSNNQTANIAHTNLELAKSYNEIGQTDKAIVLNKVAIEIYQSQNNLKTLSDAYVNHSDYYKSKSDYTKSYSYFVKHSILKDSLYSIEKVEAIEEMQTKYQTEKIKKEKEVAEQEAAIAKLESQKNRNLFIGSLIIAGLLSFALLFYFGRIKAKKKAELITIELKETQKRLAIEKQYRDSELKALKAQMNPHFIFNALNSIQDYIVLNQKNLASDYLGKFADLIRNYLHFSDTGFISIPEEIHNLNLYLELEKLRFEDKLDYVFEIEDDANSDIVKIPTMLIQPYVENALKHGLLHKKDNRILEIFISKVSDEIIECVIEDNGVGRERSKEINRKRSEQHKSFALKATNERLDLLNHGREKKIGVEVIDLKENDVAVGTKVILKIPILKKNT